MRLVMVRNILVLFLLITSSLSWAKDAPEPNKGDRAFVMDLANALSEDQEIALCQKLKAYHDSTSNEFAILIENSLEGEDAFTYSLKAARKWGVGGDEFNNGLLIFVAMKDRKAFIQVGRGLEHRITATYAGRVIDYTITPNFRKTGYYKGLDAAVDDLILFAAGEYKGGPTPDNGFPMWLIIVIIIIVIIIFSSFGSNNGRTYRNRTGGWIVGPGGGGYIGGGGGGGGGFSGGGFGGFGGGSFGGGGAGGSW
jgi:uncharacterized protein